MKRAFLKDDGTPFAYRPEATRKTRLQVLQSTLDQFQ